MLYGCRCGVVRKSNYLTTSAEMMLFWLPLSKIKCSGIPFTDICEWKIFSPSLGSSSGWIVVAAIIVVGSATMIYLLLLFFELGFKSRFDSLSLGSTTNDCIERHSSVLCQGLLWKSHHFLVPFKLSITLIFLHLGLALLRFSFLSLSMLLPLTLLLEFMLNFDFISIRSFQLGYVQEIHLCLDVPV
jgi:hypothetical protein